MFISKLKYFWFFLIWGLGFIVCICPTWQRKKTQVPNGYYHQLWATIFRWRMGVCWLGLCPVCRDRLKCLLAKRCRDSAALLCTAALHFSSVVCCLLPASCFRLFLPLLSLLPQDTLQTAAQEVSTALH